jgi:hypothetical protein
MLHNNRDKSIALEPKFKKRFEMRRMRCARFGDGAGVAEEVMGKKELGRERYLRPGKGPRCQEVRGGSILTLFVANILRLTRSRSLGPDDSTPIIGQPSYRKCLSGWTTDKDNTEE